MESGGGRGHGSRMAGKNGLVSLSIQICGNVPLNVGRQWHGAKPFKQFHGLSGRKRGGSPDAASDLFEETQFLIGNRKGGRVNRDE